MKFPEDCDPRVRDLVDQLVVETWSCLGDKLVSIVLHGSLAMGCYYFPKSDVDLLIVSVGPLSPEMRKEYFRRILRVSEGRVSVGDIELSVVQLRALQSTEDCVPYEVHFGEELKPEFESFDFARGDRCDHDLPAHFMTAYHRGVCLFGRPLVELMREPSWENFRTSIRADVDWILADKNILTTPFYSILNCCRAYLVLVEGNNRIYSKEEGALALPAFPSLKNIIQKALDAYRSENAVNPATRRFNGQDWDERDLLNFRDTFRKFFS